LTAQKTCTTSDEDFFVGKGRGCSHNYVLSNTVIDGQPH
jgi:hypothetical protein